MICLEKKKIFNLKDHHFLVINLISEILLLLGNLIYTYLVLLHIKTNLLLDIIIT